MPRLMVDSSENDGKAEIVMDYVLSWCLRRADIICLNDNKPILYRYCRDMLALLCDIDLNDSVIFKEVKVSKEAIPNFLLTMTSPNHLGLRSFLFTKCWETKQNTNTQKVTFLMNFGYDGKRHYLRICYAETSIHSPKNKKTISVRLKKQSLFFLFSENR